MKAIFILTVVSVIITASKCSDGNKTKKGKYETVTITTDYGNIKIKLYEKTPLHSENFLKLTREGYFDSTLFHRIIPQFMIQGGDPDSKNAEEKQTLGDGGPGYTIPAEFVPEYFHKKGVLAAARMSDNENPKKESSGSQFYLVVGRTFTQHELLKLEEKMNLGKKREFFAEYIERPVNSVLKQTIDSLQKSRNTEALNELAVSLEKTIDSVFIAEGRGYKFSSDQINTYTTIGGTPHLDGSYTVFGEVIEGQNVVDSISKAGRDKSDRPLKDIRIKVSVD